MNKRSPILGYNHNFHYRGLVFHVQTEDSGVDNPHIFTHLFNGGVIVSTRKVVYDATASDETVKALMQAQHKAMLKDMRRGTFDPKIDEYFGSNPSLLPAEPAARPRRETEIPMDAPMTEALPPAAAPPAVVAPPAVAATPIPDLPAPRMHIKPPTIPPIPPRKQTVPPPFNPSTQRMGSRNQPQVDVSPAMEAALRAAALPAPAPTPTPPPAGVRDTFRTPAPTEATAEEPRGTGSYVLVRKDSPDQLHTESFEPEAVAFTPQPQPPVPAVGKPSGKQKRPEFQTQPGQAPPASVVVSRPAVVIGGPSQVVTGTPARPRRTREDSRMLFGREIVNEKSLDEVILAYLGEEGSEE